MKVCAATQFGGRDDLPQEDRQRGRFLMRERNWEKMKHQICHVVVFIIVLIFLLEV